MLSTQHTTPGLSQDIIIIRDSKVSEQVVKLSKKEINSPELRISVQMRKMCRKTAADLVIHDDCSGAIFGECETLDREEIVVRNTGTSVQNNQWSLGSCSQRAKYSIPLSNYVSKFQSSDGLDKENCTPTTH